MSKSRGILIQQHVSMGKPIDKDYELLPATQKDIQKVIAFYQYGPVSGYEIGSVQVIYNPSMNRQFDLQLQFLQNRDQNPCICSQMAK